MTQWEYALWSYPFGNNKQMETTLNEAGADGWEVVAYLPHSAESNSPSRSRYSGNLLLRRPIGYLD